MLGGLGCRLAREGSVPWDSGPQLPLPLSVPSTWARLDPYLLDRDDIARAQGMVRRVRTLLPSSKPACTSYKGPSNYESGWQLDLNQVVTLGKHHRPLYDARTFGDAPDPHFNSVLCLRVLLCW